MSILKQRLLFFTVNIIIYLEPREYFYFKDYYDMYYYENIDKNRRLSVIRYKTAFLINYIVNDLSD